MVTFVKNNLKINETDNAELFALAGIVLIISCFLT